MLPFFFLMLIICSQDLLVDTGYLLSLYSVILMMVFFLKFKNQTFFLLYTAHRLHTSDIRAALWSCHQAKHFTCQ
jgi:hypothetical protein